MDLSEFTGKEAEVAQSELESLGYEVKIVNNTNKSKENSISLVVRAKKLDNNVIELVCSDFTFLS